MIVWDIESGRPVEALEGHTGDVLDVRFSADGRTLYSASAEGSAIAWDASGTRRLGARFPTGLVATPGDGYPPAFAISPDGRELAVARLDGKVDLIDARTLRTRTTFQAFGRTPATAIGYSPDGARLAVAGGRGLIGLFDARTGERLGPLVDPGGACADPASRFQRCFDATIQALAFPGRGLLATASIGGTVRIWDLARRRPIRPPLRLPRFVVGLDVSPDGSKLAVTFGFINPDNGVEILDVRSGNASPGSPPAASLDLSPSPRTAACSRAATLTAPPPSGRPTAGDRSVARSCTAASFSESASRPTDARWPRPATTGASRCGTSTLASRSAPRSHVSRTAAIFPSGARSAG